MPRPRTPSARPSRARPAVAALFLAMFVVFVVPAAAGAAQMYWGGTIKGDVYGISGEAPTSAPVLERFEHDAGKKITMVNTGQSWASFDLKTMNAAISVGAVPLVTMPLEGTLHDVVDGSQDSRIRAWARAAKAFGYPFLFRPWWEPNGNWYSWGRNGTQTVAERSSEYIAAWHHFHDIVVEEGATNVTWAWVVNTIWNDEESKPGPWYPGDEYVDWIGLDAYNWGNSPIQSDRWLTAEESIQPTLDELEQIAPGKPVCVCENGSTEYDETGRDPTHKATWIDEMLNTYLPAHPEIKAYLWFNWNNEKPGVSGRFDWPIESSPEAETAFREGIAAPDYLSRIPALTKLTKVPMPSTLPPPEGSLPPELEPETPEGDAGGGASSASGSGASTVSPLAAVAATGTSAPVDATPVALGAPRLRATTGTARVPLWIPGAGDLQVSASGATLRILSATGPARRSIARHIPMREPFMLQVSASGTKLRELGARGVTKVTVLVRFTPSGGQPSQRRLTITLRAQT